MQAQVISQPRRIYWATVAKSPFLPVFRWPKYESVLDLFPRVRGTRLCRHCDDPWFHLGNRQGCRDALWLLSTILTRESSLWWCGRSTSSRRFPHSVLRLSRWAAHVEEVQRQAKPNFCVHAKGRRGEPLERTPVRIPITQLLAKTYHFWLREIQTLVLFPPC